MLDGVGVPIRPYLNELDLERGAGVPSTEKRPSDSRETQSKLFFKLASRRRFERLALG